MFLGFSLTGFSLESEQETIFLVFSSIPFQWCCKHSPFNSHVFHRDNKIVLMLPIALSVGIFSECIFEVTCRCCGIAMSDLQFLSVHSACLWEGVSLHCLFGCVLFCFALFVFVRFIFNFICFFCKGLSEKRNGKYKMYLTVCNVHYTFCILFILFLVFVFFFFF